MKRWSLVGEMKVNSIILASIFQIGDNESIQPKSKALAVQRELPVFWGNEGDFNRYPLFSREIPQLQVHEPLRMSVENEDNAIRVGCVRVLALSSSSVIQVGSNTKIEADSRIKHFRQFVSELHAPSQPIHAQNKR